MIVYAQYRNEKLWVVFLKWLLPRKVSITLITRNRVLNPMMVKVGRPYAVQTWTATLTHKEDSDWCRLLELSPKTMREIQELPGFEKVKVRGVA